MSDSRFGALPPPGVYAKQEAVRIKLGSEPGVKDTHLCAGFTGMGVLVITEDEKSKEDLLNKFGLLKKRDRAMTSDGKICQKTYHYSLIDEVEVLYQVKAD